MDCCNFVILLGPPGVGKGTLANFCISEMNFQTVSTGQILREHIAQETTLGIQVKQQITAGQLVDDALVDQIFASWFKKQKSEVRVLLDGYPRTVLQAEFLLKLLQHSDFLQHSVVFLMEAEAEVVKSRILGRLLCSNKDCGKIYAVDTLENKVCVACGAFLIKRGDDNPVVALKRLNDYLLVKNDLLMFFQRAGIPIKVSDTTQFTPEEVFSDFKRKIGMAAVI